MLPITIILILFVCNIFYQKHLASSWDIQHEHQHTNEYEKFINFQINLPNDAGVLNIYLKVQFQELKEERPHQQEQQQPEEQQRKRDENREQHFTVEEAIEIFRQDHIEKESQIGGIYESSRTFHRHFNLKYNNFEVRVRCNYVSYYELKSLRIFCYKYNEINLNSTYDRHTRSYMFERENLPINTTTIDVRDYLQTLHMTIQ